MRDINGMYSRELGRICFNNSISIYIPNYVKRRVENFQTTWKSCYSAGHIQEFKSLSINIAKPSLKGNLLNQ